MNAPELLPSSMIFQSARNLLDPRFFRRSQLTGGSRIYIVGRLDCSLVSSRLDQHPLGSLTGPASSVPSIAHNHRQRLEAMTKVIEGSLLQVSRKRALVFPLRAYTLVLTYIPSTIIHRKVLSQPPPGKISPNKTSLVHHC